MCPQLHIPIIIKLGIFAYKLCLFNGDRTNAVGCSQEFHHERPFNDGGINASKSPFVRIQNYHRNSVNNIQSSHILRIQKPFQIVI